MQTTTRWLTPIGPTGWQLYYALAFLVLLPGTIVWHWPPGDVFGGVAGALFGVAFAASGVVMLRLRPVLRRPTALTGSVVTVPTLRRDQVGDLHAARPPQFDGTGMGEAVLVLDARETRFALDGTRLLLAADGLFRRGRLSAEDLEALADVVEARPQQDADDVVLLLRRQAAHQAAGRPLDTSPLAEHLHTRLERRTLY